MVEPKSEESQQSERPLPPWFYANMVHLAGGAYDATFTFIHMNPTVLPENINGQHNPTQQAQVEVNMPVGLLKAMIPLIVKAIADYETRFGPIPAPGFEEGQKA